VLKGLLKCQHCGCSYSPEIKKALTKNMLINFKKAKGYRNNIKLSGIESNDLGNYF